MGNICIVSAMIGPNGEKRPTDVIANAVHVMRVATGEAEEEYVDQAKRAAGLKGGAARAAALTPERRREIAQMGAAERNGTNGNDVG